MLLYGQVISEDLAHVTEEEARSFAARKKFEIDVRLRLPTGEIRWRRFISSPRTASNGDLLWDGIELDITEWKLVQETLLDRSQRVAQLGSWEHDLVNNILKCSSEAYRIFGIERQEFATTYEAYMEYVHPDDRAAVNAAYFGSMKLEGEPYDHEYRIVRPDGEIRVIHGKADHMRDSSGRIIRSVGIVHDITDRKRREKALHESEAHLKRAQEIAQLGSWELNLVTNEITWSDEVYRIFGFRPQEFGATYEAFLETVGTHAAERRHLGELLIVRLVEPGREFELRGAGVRPFSTPHTRQGGGLADPVAYCFFAGGAKAGYATDLGHPTGLMAQHLAGCRLLVLEFNHDPAMLVGGPYPWPVKQWIKEQGGHLSNEQAARLLERVLHDRLDGLVLAHLSETNNTPELARAAAREALERFRLHERVELRVAGPDTTVTIALRR